MIDKILSLLDITPAQAVIWVSYVVSALVSGWGAVKSGKSVLKRARLKRTQQETRTVASAVTELIKTQPIRFCTCGGDVEGLPSDYSVTINGSLTLPVCPSFYNRQKYRVCNVYIYPRWLDSLDTTVQNQLCEILDQRYLEHKLKKEA